MEKEVVFADFVTEFSIYLNHAMISPLVLVAEFFVGNNTPRSTNKTWEVVIMIFKSMKTNPKANYAGDAFFHNKLHQMIEFPYCCVQTLHKGTTARLAQCMNDPIASLAAQ